MKGDGLGFVNPGVKLGSTWSLRAKLGLQPVCAGLLSGSAGRSPPSRAYAAPSCPGGARAKRRDIRGG